MPQFEESNVEDRKEFEWGRRKGVGGKNKDKIFYGSYSYNGEEYFLYDCVYLYPKHNQTETSIGKLVKLFETPEHEKKAKMVQFFRPVGIRELLKDVNKEPRYNEIFLASGQGFGLSDIVFVEAIIKKCNVVCASTDERNPQLSERMLEKAEYFFCRTLDVEKIKILDEFPDQIAGVKVEFFFNGRIQRMRSLASIEKGSQAHKEEERIESTQQVNQHVKGDDEPWIDDAAVHEGPRKCGASRKPKVRTFSGVSHPPLAASPSKKRKVLHGELLSKERSMDVLEKLKETPEKTKKTSEGGKNYFKKLPWEQNILLGQEKGSLVILENLDPSLSSAEVEYIVKCAFDREAEARMIPHTAISNPNYGRAIVILKNKRDADDAISKLTEGCLVLDDERVVTGYRATLPEQKRQGNFNSHMVINRFMHKQSADMKNAVSTSHCAQPNNIEFEMALQWCELQCKSDLWWKALQEKQMKEMDYLTSQLKSSRIS